MTIRLLQKYEIDKRKAEEKRQTMEEGLQIAGRVDTLREIVASEEVAFEKYRTDRLKDIQSEIAEKEQERNKLDALVSQAKVEHERLIASLDERWNEVNVKNAFIETLKNKFEEKLDLLENKHSSLTVRENDIIEKEKLTDIQHTSATSYAERAKKLFEDTKIASEKVRIDMFFKENELSKKETSFETIQREFIDQRDTLMKSLKEKEQELDQERAKITIINQQLADQRRTLERAMARLQK